MFYHFLLLFSLFFVGNSTISDGFYSHILKNYGKKAADRLARKDLGWKGSFGGGEDVGPILQKKVPILFVHGQTRRAGDLQYVLKHFLEDGYTYDEVFGTSYGTNVTHDNYHSDMVYCKYIMQIRSMLEAVLSYTKHEQIDIVAFSMGAGMTRKAILGGECVDTKENLGLSLTSKIRNYVSVAGVQRGVVICDKVKDYVPLCNGNNGLHCDSDYNRDINTPSGYEATERIVAIETTSDDILGATTSCKTDPALFTGANEVYTLNGLDHRAAIWFLGEVVYNITQKMPLKSMEDIAAEAIRNAEKYSDYDIGILP
ncbi:unnamed protein product [Bursaphelenchus okinawaensis]|uniref:Lipase n=1 Tax=Bursaphelenchus okinawaensis TaxID=465554 RepID=A0A811KZ23_9BILA|nr:unnamed protein product [Bursaphelenchus okinawaensis]CAG9114138.1 unnamed protein product [Bursaphelenchus okinawaensis]